MTEPNQKRTKVALVSASSYGEETKTAVKTAVDLTGGIGKIVQSGDTVLIKPNLVNIYSAESGNTTHVSLIESLIEACHLNGASQIFVGDGSSEFETEAAFIISGVKKSINQARRNGIPVELVDLNHDKNPETNEFETVNLRKEGLHSNPTYRIAHTVLDSDVIISVPKLKAHSLTGISVTLKNMIGIAPCEYYGFPRRRNGGLPHGDYRKPLHNDVIWRIILDLNRIALGKYADSPKERRYMAVVDGVVAGAYHKAVDLGDQYWMAVWKPIKIGAIIAGFDPVAVDTVSARLMCYRPEKIPLITHAAENGFGTMRDIDVLGEKVKDLRTFVPQSRGFLSIAEMHRPKLLAKALSCAFKSNATEKLNYTKYSIYGFLKKHDLCY